MSDPKPERPPLEEIETEWAIWKEARVSGSLDVFQSESVGIAQRVGWLLAYCRALEAQQQAPLPAEVDGLVAKLEDRESPISHEECRSLAAALRALARERAADKAKLHAARMRSDCMGRGDECSTPGPLSKCAFHYARENAALSERLEAVLDLCKAWMVVANGWPLSGVAFDQRYDLAERTRAAARSAAQGDGEASDGD